MLCHHHTALISRRILDGNSHAGHSVSSVTGDSMTIRRANNAAVMLKAAYSRGGFVIPGRELAGSRYPQNGRVVRIGGTMRPDVALSYYL